MGANVTLPTLQELLERAKVPAVLQPWAVQWLPVFGKWTLLELQAWVALLATDADAAYARLLDVMDNTQFVAAGAELVARARRARENAEERRNLVHSAVVGLLELLALVLAPMVGL